MLRRYEDNRLVWIPPGDIRYDKEDIYFLLPFLKELREGYYLGDPQDNGEKRHGRGFTNAYYEMACQIAAEIDERLSHTGRDSYMVEDYYSYIQEPGITEDDILQFIASKTRLTKDYIKHRVNLAISYISSGECQRWVVCEFCIKYDDCHKKNRGRRNYSYEQWIQSRSSYYSRIGGKS